MPRVGQGLHEFGAAQGCLGVVLELQDPSLPQLRFVSGDDMGDGDGVDESEAAQQSAREPAPQRERPPAQGLSDCTHGSQPTNPMAKRSPQGEQRLANAHGPGLLPQHRRYPPRRARG